MAEGPREGALGAGAYCSQVCSVCLKGLRRSKNTQYSLLNRDNNYYKNEAPFL